MAKIEKSGNRKLGLFNSLILTANILFLLALILAYLSVHISPEKSRILPFFGLIYPYLLLVNFFLAIYWLLRRRWLFLLSAVIIAIGWNHVERAVQIRSTVTKPAGLDSFKILTFNVKNLSNDNVDLLEPEIRRKIIEYLGAEDADIICLQEFALVHPDPEAFIDSLSGRLNMPYHAYSLYTEKVRKRIDAIYIFSKFPIINHGSLKKDNLHNYAIYADLLIETDSVRLFNVHLESVRLKQEDYIFLSDLDLQFEENENIKESSKRIFKKLRTAFTLRASQADSLASCIRNSPYPVILCGDFNDTPNSYAYQQLSVNLKDAFMESGKGFGNTYIGKLPSYRIDYILYSEYFTSWECSRELIKLSDHYPVSCLVGIRNRVKK